MIEAEGAVENAALLAGPQGTITPAFRAALEYGRDASSARLVDSFARIATAGAACARAMQGVDALLMPTAPQRAFVHGSEVPANQADFCALANFSNRPAVSLPVPLNGEILPASVQLIGHPGDDPRLLSIADVLDRALNSAATER